MHPYEIGNNYECLNKENITVINNRDKDLYYYQSISIAQVGIYSTGLYEGLAFNLLTFIINNKYGTSEIKSILKDDKSITYVDTPFDVQKRLNKKNKIEHKYWNNVNYDNIIKNLKKIINR